MGHLEKCGYILWNNGIICISIAALAFSIAASLVRLINPDESIFQIVSARSFFSLSLSFLAAWSNDIRPIFGKLENFPLLAFRGIVGAAAMDCFYHSVQRLALAEALALLFCNPAITAMLAWIVLGEHLTLIGSAGCIISLFGMILVVRPPFLLSPREAETWNHDRTMGVISGIASAFLAGMAYMTIRAIGKKEHSLCVAVWFHTSALVHSTVLLIFGIGGHAIQPSNVEWLYFVAIAVSSFTANLLISRGLQLESAALGSAINYTQVVYGALWGFLFFNEPLHPLSILGAALIATGVIALALGRNKKSIKSHDELSGKSCTPEEENLLGNPSVELSGEIGESTSGR